MSAEFYAEEYYNSSNITNYINYDQTAAGQLPLPPFTYPLFFQTLIYTLYTAIFITALIGNLLVITVVTTQAKMRTPTNYLILNLALGDLLSTLFCLPFGYISILQQQWLFGEVLCNLVIPLQCVFVFISAWTLVVLSLERLMGIVYFGGRWGSRGVFLGVGAVWFGSVLVSVPIMCVVGVTVQGDRVLCEEIYWPSPSLRLTYTLTLLFLQYFLPISVLIFTYSRIAVEIWWKKSCPVLESGGSLKSVREERLERAKTRTISTLLLVVTCYTLSWLPLNLLYLYLEVIQDVEKDPFEHFEYIYVLCHWIAMAHTTFNPIIYCGSNEKFREGFTIVLKGLWTCSCWKNGRHNRSMIERGGTGRGCGGGTIGRR